MKRIGAIGLAACLAVALAGTALAAASVNLGTAKSFAVLAGTTITNTGATTITGDVGVHPGKTATGFTTVTLHGAKHLGDAVALSAKNSLVTAYNDAAGATPVTNVPTELGGTTLEAGVYASDTLGLTGTLTLDGTGVYIFQAGSTLITAPNSKVASSTALGMQRLLAGRQLGNAGHVHELQGHDHGPHLDLAQDRRDAAGPGTGTQRCRHHGPQHHQQLRVRGAQFRDGARFHGRHESSAHWPAVRQCCLAGCPDHRPFFRAVPRPPRHRRDRIRRRAPRRDQPIPHARLTRQQAPTQVSPAESIRPGLIDPSFA